METNEELIILARRLPELFQEAQLGETRYLEEDDLAALDAAGYAAVAVAQKLVDALEAATTAAAGVPASGSTSDGHHTFDELYDYRMLYNAHAAHGWLAAGGPVVKSWKHSDGELCFGGGWFIVTATLPTGQVSNHYKAEHWGLFAVPEVDLPPEYDGHTPQDAAERLRAAAGVTPQEPPRTAAPTAKVLLRGSDSDCASGVCPKGCSHLMWFCDQCSCEGGWGGTEEFLEALAVQHICPAPEATPQEPASERCGDCGDKLDYVAGLDGQGCYPHCWRCWYKDHPVEIPVQVDEAKLAEIAVSEVEEFEATAGPDRPLSHVGISIARAIAKHLRGGGQ